jgi:hypothetical protein
MYRSLAEENEDDRAPTSSLRPMKDDGISENAGMTYMYLATTHDGQHWYAMGIEHSTLISHLPVAISYGRKVEKLEEVWESRSCENTSRKTTHNDVVDGNGKEHYEVNAEVSGETNIDWLLRTVFRIGLKVLRNKCNSR